MKKSLILLNILITLFFLRPDNCKAQSQFQITIGGENNDEAFLIVQTTDGGYAAAGYTFSFGAGFGDMYIVKLNSNGTIQWTKTIGSTSTENARSFVQTADGGYVLAGQRLYSMVGTDPYLVKLSPNGTIEWSKAENYQSGDVAYSIIQTTDGGYAVGCDNYIMKLDGSGTLVWSKGISGGQGARVIIQTMDSGYALAGGLQVGFGDLYIIKLSSNGAFLWSKTVGGSANDFASSIIQTSDGGYALAGNTKSFGAGNDDIYILKFNSSGTLQWSRTVGGTDNDKANSIIQTTNGEYAIAGFTESFGAGNKDMYIIRLNSSGTLLWSRTVGGAADDEASSVIQTTDGGYIMAGYTNSFGIGNKDMFIVKLDASGNTCGNNTIPASMSGIGGTVNSPSTNVTSMTNTLNTYTSTENTGGVLTSVCYIGIEPITNEIPHSFKIYQNYPNPFNPSTYIKFDIPKEQNVKITLVDILGREVKTLVNEYIQEGEYEIQFNAADVASGTYFYRIESGDFVETKKMVLLK